MQRRAVVIGANILAVLILCALAPAQGSKRLEPRAASKSPEQGATHLLALPIEVQFGYYRDDSKAIFLTVKNDDRSRMIRSVSCLILINDTTQRKPKVLPVLDFDFSINIKPGEIGSAVICDEDPVAMDWSDHIAGDCGGYTPAGGEQAQSNSFLPDKCRAETYTVIVQAIKFSDGSMWEARKR